MEIKHTETEAKRRKKAIVALAMKLIEHCGIYVTAKTVGNEYKREIGNYYTNALYNLFPRIAEYLEDLYIKYNGNFHSNELIITNLTKMFVEFLIEEANSELKETIKNNNYNLVIEPIPKFIVNYDSETKIITVTLEYNGITEAIKYDESINEEFDYYVEYMAKKEKSKPTIFQVTNGRKL